MSITIPRDLYYRSTASIVSYQSCVVYTTFVGNSVLSFTTSELNHYPFADDSVLDAFAGENRVHYPFDSVLNALAGENRVH